MTAAAIKVLFVDRDGTLVEEPADEQVDSLAKIRFLPGVFAALQQLMRAGFRLVMVTNQDGLGTPSFPLADFDAPQRFILDAFASQGITFDAVLHLPARARAMAASAASPDGARRGLPGRAPHRPRRSARDRRPRHGPGVRREPRASAACACGAGGGPEETWPAVTRGAAGAPRRSAAPHQGDRHQRRAWTWTPRARSRSAPGTASSTTCSSSWPSTAASRCSLSCKGDLHIDEHHTVEDCALALGEALRKALGDKLGIARYGFLLPMDEARVQVALDLSGRPYCAVRGPFRPRAEVGGLATELVPHFFRSLAETLGAALHISVTWREHAPHGGGVLQGHRARAAAGVSARGHRAAQHQGRAVMPAEVAIIDSGGANLASLVFALQRLGAEAQVTDRRSDPRRAARAAARRGLGRQCDGAPAQQRPARR